MPAENDVVFSITNEGKTLKACRLWSSTVFERQKAKDKFKDCLRTVLIDINGCEVNTVQLPYPSFG